MNRKCIRWVGLLSFAMLGLHVQSGKAQFFLGGPTISSSTTGGTITLMPTFTANQATREIDITGQLHVSNAGTGVHTVMFNVQWGLDPTYNGGNPIAMQLQLSQSGFVIVPGGGQIYDWNIHSSVVGPPGAIQGSVNDFAPNPPYLPGTTFYGPTVVTGAAFTYSPAGAAFFELSFVSTFDGVSTNNLYVWDFPLTVYFDPVPEPSSIGLCAAGVVGVAYAIRKRRHKRANAA